MTCDHPLSAELYSMVIWRVESLSVKWFKVLLVDHLTMSYINVLVLVIDVNNNVVYPLTIMCAINSYIGSGYNTLPVLRIATKHYERATECSSDYA